MNSLAEAGKLWSLSATGRLAAAVKARQNDGMLTLDSVSPVSHEEHVGVLGPWSLRCLLSITGLALPFALCSWPFASGGSFSRSGSCLLGWSLCRSLDWSGCC